MIQQMADQGGSAGGGRGGFGRGRGRRGRGPRRGARRGKPEDKDVCPCNHKLIQRTLFIKFYVHFLYIAVDPSDQARSFGEGWKNQAS